MAERKTNMLEKIKEILVEVKEKRADSDYNRVRLYILAFGLAIVLVISFIAEVISLFNGDISFSNFFSALIGGSIRWYAIVFFGECVLAKIGKGRD